MIAWALETFVATTLMLVLVLVLRGPVRQHFGPQLAYALWVIPLVRAVMPPLPGNWQLTRLFAPVTRQVVEAPGVVVGLMPPASLPPEAALTAVNASFDIGSHHTSLALAPPTTVANGPSLALLLLGIWAIGALAFLAYHLIAHSRYCATLLRRARIDRTVAQGRVRVIETDAAHGPLAFGVFRKYVAFPRDFAERYDEQERDLALAHELGHHVRGDLIANWAALFVLAIHWFNPVAWRAFRAFRADQEMACDALVLAGRAQALRHAYGRAIVKSAHGGAVSAACHLHTINDVKGRLRMLSKTHRHSPKRIAAGLAGGGALALTALGLTASGTQAAEHIKKSVETTIVTMTQDMPAPPAAPAPPAPPANVQVPEAPEAPEAPEPPAPGKRVYRYTVSDATGSAKTREIVIHPGTMMMSNVRISVPEIRDGKCGKVGKDRETVIHREEAGKKVMIVCADRIEAMAAESQQLAMKSKELGLMSARMGIRHARAAIEADTTLTDTQRKAAIAGLDEALDEIAREGKED